MNDASTMLVRHLSGFVAAFDAFTKEMKRQLDELKKEQEKLKQS